MRRALLTLAGVGAAVLVGAAPASAANCDDFATQPEAQAAFAAGDTGLDGNDQDGIACESLPPGPQPAPSIAPPMKMPVGGVDTGGGSTAGMENQGLLVGGAAAMLGGAVLYTVRRREV